MTAIRSVVLGCGSYLPQRILTNAELATRIDTSDEWIVQRTGIRQRHIAADGEFTSHLAINAARAALDSCRRRCAIDRPDRAGHLDTGQYLSGHGGAVQNGLGIHHGAAFDLQAVCSGFVFALTDGRQFPAQRGVQTCARDRRGDVLANSRLERSRHLRAVRRRRRRGGAGRPDAAGTILRPRYLDDASSIGRPAQVESYMSTAVRPRPRPSVISGWKGAKSSSTRSA